MLKNIYKNGLEMVVKFTLLIFSGIGLLKIASIVPFNKMAADDYSSAFIGKDGLWKALVTTYTGFMGRFSAVLIETPFSTSLAYNGKISVYSSITFFALFLAILFLVKRFFKISFNNIYLYIFSILLFTCLYQLTPNKSESWYWLTGSAVYLWPIILFTYALSFVFKEKYSKLDFVLAPVFTFFSVGGNEAFGLIVLTSLFILSFLNFKNEDKKRKFLVFSMFLASLISFLIVYLAPGNDVRKAAPGSNPMSLVGSILYSIGEGPKLYQSLIFQNIYILLPITVLFTYLLGRFNNNHNKPETGIDHVLTKAFLFLMSGVILSIIFMTPSFVGLGRVQPERSQLSLVYIILIQSVLIGNILSVYAKEKIKKDNIYYKLIVFVFSIMLLSSTQYFTSRLASDIYVAKNYSSHFDQMITRFKEISNSGDTESEIEVSLPPSGLMADLLDPVGKYSYKNLSLSQYYNIGKVITVEYEEKN